MNKLLLIDAVHPEETRVVLTDTKSTIHEFDFTTASKQQIKGNIYLAKVTRVEPSLQAAFVEYGGNKQGFLPFSEIHPDYYQIPISDRQRLMEEEEAAFAEEEYEDSDEPRSRRRKSKRRDDDAVQAADEHDAETDSDTDADDEGDDDDERLAADAERGERVESSVIDDAELGDDDADSASARSGDEEHDGDKRGERRFRRRRRNNRRTHIRSVEDDSDEVETISGEEELERPQRRGNYARRYKIQEVIKRNQILLVQVIKEERGNKGVSLTSFISLAGRYCVLMPNSPRGGGVSRKIGTGEERKKLKQIIADLTLPKGMSVIIRTAGAERTRAEIRRDFDYLVKLWNQIREDTLSSSAPAVIYEESNLIKRTIRDIYNNDIESIFVDGESAYKEAKSFMKMMIPSHAPKVKLHKSDVPLFHEFNVEDQLLAMSDPIVKLRSGGYLVINPTEALISIDVNSGRSTSERNVEETAVKTNIEAAKEVARQLRLRDLAGLIVIDFIDMIDGKNRRAVERAFKEALRADRAKIQVGRISSFGLMELSRQRLRPSINESLNQPCSHCNGTGHIRSDSATAIQVIRGIEKEASTGNQRQFNIHVTPAIAMHLVNEMRHELDTLEAKFEVTLRIMIDDSLKPGNFRIEKIRDRNKGGNERQQSAPSTYNPPAASENESPKPSEDGSSASGTGEKRRSRRRGGRRRNRNNEDRNEEQRFDHQASDNAEAASDADHYDDEAAPAERERDEASSRDEKPARNDRRSRRRGSKPVETESTQEEFTAKTKASPKNVDVDGADAVDNAVAANDAGTARKGRTATSRRSTSRKTEKASEESVVIEVKREKPAAKADSADAVDGEAKAKKTRAPRGRKVADAPVGDSFEAPAAAAAASNEPKRKGWWQKIID